MKHRTVLAAAMAVIALAIAWAPSANATLATYDFSYTFSGGVDVLTGTLDGTLQPDNNTVVVSAITNAAFDGVPGPALPYLNSLEGFLSLPGFPPVASLDGSILDFISCTDATCSDGFLLDSQGVFSAGTPEVITGLSFGAIRDEIYDPARWSMTAVAVTAVPEPGTIGLIVSGIFGLALLRRRSGRARPNLSRNLLPSA